MVCFPFMVFMRSAVQFGHLFKIIIASSLALSMLIQPWLKRGNQIQIDFYMGYQINIIKFGNINLTNPIGFLPQVAVWYFHYSIPFHEIQDNFVLKDSLFYFVFDDTSRTIQYGLKTTGTDGATENDRLIMAFLLVD
jgi:hypothetical protein